MDLSNPGGASVNDGINPDEFTLHYIAVDLVILMVSQFGQGALNIVERLKVLFSSCKTVVLYLVGSSQISFSADLPRCWYIWKLFQPQFPHRPCNGCRFQLYIRTLGEVLASLSQKLT